MKTQTRIFVSTLLALLNGIVVASGHPIQAVLAGPNGPGQIRFQQSSLYMDEDAGMVEIVIKRINGSDGEVLVGADKAPIHPPYNRSLRYFQERVLYSHI